MNVLYSIWGLRKLLIISQNLLFNLIYRKVFNNKVTVFGLPIISIANASMITVGDHLVLISSSYFSGPGVNHPTIIRTLTPEARLQIGNNVGISGGGICVAKEVIIGDNVLMGANAFITDTDFHPVQPENRRFRDSTKDSKTVVIEDNVFIGMNSLILKGVTIGKSSVIGAGSIVTKDIPPDSIAFGIPAKVTRQIK